MNAEADKGFETRVLHQRTGISMTNRLWRGWQWLLVASIVAVPLCIVYVDRPLATFFDRYVTGTSGARVVVGLLAPLKPLVLITFIFLLGCGLRVLSDRELPRRARA